MDKSVVDYQITIDRNKPLLSMVIDLSMVDFSLELLNNSFKELD